MIRIIVLLLFVFTLDVSTYGQPPSRKERKLTGTWAWTGSFIVLESGEWEKVEENMIDTLYLLPDHTIEFRHDNKGYNIPAYHICKWGLAGKDILQISDRKYISRTQPPPNLMSNSKSEKIQEENSGLSFLLP